MAACIYIHNCTLQEETNASDSDETAEKKKKKEKKKKEKTDTEVCMSVRICMHLLASVCICMHLCIEYSLNTPAFEARREPVLSRASVSTSSRVTSREAGLVIYVSSSSSV